MYEWLPESRMQQEDFHTFFLTKATNLRKVIMKQNFETAERERLLKLIQFIQEEMLNEEQPRSFLIDSALLSIKQSPFLTERIEFQEFERTVSSEFRQAP